jgi:hypothetical protein
MALALIVLFHGTWIYLVPKMLVRSVGGSC